MLAQRSWLAAAAAVVLVPAGASATEPYCVDNPAVIYCNDFEGGTLDGLEVGPRATWVSAQADGMHTYEGDGALLADFTPPYGAEAEFGARFAGVDRVYARFYMRFDDSWDAPMHHFYAIHGDRPDDMWSCHGDAGCRPDGVRCLSGTTVDTRMVVDGELPGQPFFYTYHPEMNCDPGDSCANYADPQAICDGCADRGLPCDDGLECCWGENLDIQDQTISLVADTWYAVETMVAANTPGVADGEMTLWIDGVQIGHVAGIRWRDDPLLQLNHFIVWNYYPETEVAHRIWFDNLVISTEPVGVLGGSSGDSSGGDVTGGDGDSGGASTAATASASASGTASDGGSTAAGTGGSAAEDGGGSSGGAASEGDGGGCGCRAGGAGWGTLPLVVFAGLIRRRQGGASHRDGARERRR